MKISSMADSWFHQRYHWWHFCTSPNKCCPSPDWSCTAINSIYIMKSIFMFQIFTKLFTFFHYIQYQHYCQILYDAPGSKGIGEVSKASKNQIVICGTISFLWRSFGAHNLAWFVITIFLPLLWGDLCFFRTDLHSIWFELSSRFFVLLRSFEWTHLYWHRDVMKILRGIINKSCECISWFLVPVPCSK